MGEEGLPNDFWLWNTLGQAEAVLTPRCFKSETKMYSLSCLSVLEIFPREEQTLILCLESQIRYFQKCSSPFHEGRQKNIYILVHFIFIYKLVSCEFFIKLLYLGSLSMPLRMSVSSFLFSLPRRSSIYSLFLTELYKFIDLETERHTREKGRI